MIVKRLISTQWGRAFDGTNGGFFEPPANAMGFSGNTENPNGVPFGKIIGNFGARINEDIDAIWIGGNSEASDVQIFAPNSEIPDNIFPISVGTKQPFVGRLKGPIYIYQNSPIPNNVLLLHTLELFYVPACGLTEGVIPYFAGRNIRRYNFGLITLAAATPQVFFIPAYGRYILSVTAQNTGANNMDTYAIRGMITTHDQPGTFTPDPNNNTFSNSLVASSIAAGANNTSLQSGGGYEWFAVTMTSTLGTTARLWATVKDQN